MPHEAVEDLATRVGLVVPHEAGAAAPAEAADATAPLYELLTKVSDFYHAALGRNERAADYGTRCSTLVKLHRTGELQLTEWTWDPAGALAGKVRFSFQISS